MRFSGNNVFENDVYNISYNFHPIVLKFSWDVNARLPKQVILTVFEFQLKK